MLEEDMEVAIKVVVVGNGAVGKSSMIQRYCKGIFTKDYKKTIGVDFLERQIIVNDEEVRLMLWDTAGQEEFEMLSPRPIIEVLKHVLVFSTTDRGVISFIVTGGKFRAEVGDIPEFWYSIFKRSSTMSPAFGSLLLVLKFFYGLKLLVDGAAASVTQACRDSCCRLQIPHVIK
ncbi:ras-related protein Rab-23 [Lates japonicus]|uniref:Ras-related protein Rab-23 n=1 Tax=Lates japonicus TaxID=270547 RepID=A0AAD3N2S5_LATJO|nr:ras-related protein Rab-23 [Lates japonicus]